MGRPTARMDAWKAGGLPLYPAPTGTLPPGITRAASQGWEAMRAKDRLAEPAQ